jgi:hypothetical protein
LDLKCELGTPQAQNLKKTFCIMAGPITINKNNDHVLPTVLVHNIYNKSCEHFCMFPYSGCTFQTKMAPKPKNNSLSHRNRATCPCIGNAAE